MTNLLVIDFDFFFRNPMEAGDTKNQEYWLYDWGHSESKMYIDGFIWPTRAFGFMNSGLPLPRADVPANFWNRFTFDDDAKLYVADSNAYAGLLYDSSGEPFTDVYLFDAHHDLYKIRNQRELMKWHDTGKDITCENWMFKHLMRGSRLHWRIPQWHGNGPDMADSVPDWVNLDARYDDGKPMHVEIDTAFLCRSGAWVPPWCDDQFDELMRSAPVVEVEQLDDYDLRREGWEEANAALYKSWSDAERKVLGKS